MREVCLAKKKGSEKERKQKKEAKSKGIKGE
jgi:hypothetical protein